MPGWGPLPGHLRKSKFDLIGMEMVLAEIERILITGSRGWIGSRVCKVLKEQGMNVATIAHDMPTHEIVAASRAAKVVVHAGASPFVDRHTVFETGLDQAMAVARGVCEVDNSVILLSSTKVYGLAGIEDKTVTEDAKPDPDCAYGRAKLAAEEMLAATSSRCRILRRSPTTTYNVGRAPSSYSRPGSRWCRYRGWHRLASRCCSPRTSTSARSGHASSGTGAPRSTPGAQAVA